ncbi:protein SLX4IP [Pelodytes ibericus]
MHKTSPPAQIGSAYANITEKHDSADLVCGFLVMMSNKLVIKAHVFPVRITSHSKRDQSRDVSREISQCLRLNADVYSEINYGFIGAIGLPLWKRICILADSAICVHAQLDQYLYTQYKFHTTIFKQPDVLDRRAGPPKLRVYCEEQAFRFQFLGTTPSRHMGLILLRMIVDGGFLFLSAVHVPYNILKVSSFVLQCGNFAVLVDLHVLPQGTSKDTSWFSDQEKEEVCMLLRDTIDSRVRQHIESRKQQGQLKSKEYTQSSPLFLKGSSIRIAAYFIKRWINLRCIVKQQYRELHVFPDRFVVFASQLETDTNAQIQDCNRPANTRENCSSGTSEYFAERKGIEITNIPCATPKKQAVLKNIVKKTKSTNNNEAETDTGKKVFPCPSQAETDKKVGGSNKEQTLSSTQSEAKCRSAEQPKYCTDTTENSLELPLPGVENHVNHRQPCVASSQQNTTSAAWLKAQDVTKALSWFCDSAVPEQRTNLGTNGMQQKRRRHSSDGRTQECKRADLRDDTFIYHNVQVNNSNREPEQAIEDIPLRSRICSFQKISAGTGGSLTTISGEKMTGTNELLEQTANDQLSAHCSSEHSQPYAMSSVSNIPLEKNISEDNRKSAESHTKKLKLQRSKKGY